MFKKILVANRGEIAIRAFRAAYELGAKTVAVFPYEDRNSMHRLKADEAYQIGEEGHPVRAYLDVDEIIRVALACGADAIYPGYGFLSENPELAARDRAQEVHRDPAQPQVTARRQDVGQQRGRRAAVLHGGVPGALGGLCRLVSVVAQRQVEGGHPLIMPGRPPPSHRRCAPTRPA